MRFGWLGAFAALMTADTLGAAELPLMQAEEVVVTATRFRDRYADTPVNMTVITAEAIRASTAKTLPDLLSEQAGMIVHDFFGNNAATTMVDLRGFGATGGQNTLILVDGRRAADIDLSGVQWSALPLAMIERVEIVRGGGAVLYGDGATGGVVNIITRSPQAAARGASVELRAGSYATREAHAAASHSGSRGGFHLAASNFESDGYRVNNRNRQSNAHADVRWLSGEGGLALKLGADRQGIRLPGARTVQPSANLDQLASDRRGTNTPLDYAQRDGNRAALDWHRTTTFGELHFGAGWRDKVQTSYFDFGGFPDYRVVDLDVLALTPRVRMTAPLAGLPNTLVAGVDWYRWRYRLRRSNAATAIGRPINSVDATQENHAVYLHNTTRLDERLTLSAGVRAERFAIDAADAFDPAAPGAAFGSGAVAGSQRESQHAYEVGLRYQLDPGSALIGKIARSFRFATVDETYETSPQFMSAFQFLRPQTARGYEIGYEARRGGGWLRAALFLIEVTDEIHLDPFSTGVGNTNLPPSRRRGLELESRWPVTRALQLTAAYAYSHAVFREGTLEGGDFTRRDVVIAGRTVPLVPRHKATLTASWAIDGRTRLNAALSYVSAQFMDNDEGNTGVKIPAYRVADLKLVHRRGPWRVTLAVNNIFDEKYYNYAVRSQFVPDRYNAYPLPERNLGATVEYSLR